MWDNDNSNSTVNFTQKVPEFAKSVNNEVTEYVAQLYNFNDLNKSRINTIINTTSELFQYSLNLLANKICYELESQGVDQNCLLLIKNTVGNFTTLFQNVRTESRRFALFKNYNTFIFPESYKIGERVEYKSKPTGTSRELV